MKNDLVLGSSHPIEVQIPTTATTMSGVVFDPREDRWAYRDGVLAVSINFGELIGATTFLVGALKLTLLWYVKHRAPGYPMSLFYQFKFFLKTLFAQTDQPLSEITVANLINYRSKLSPSTAWYLGKIAPMLKKWHRLGYAGVSSECVRFLNQLRIGGNIKGSAVLTFDSKNGPFTDIELEAIQCAFNTAFADEEISLDEYVLGWLFMLLGQRPIQYALLKVCDVTVGRSKEGADTYIIKIPRVKQGSNYVRDEFKERLLIPQIGTLLVKYAAAVEKMFVNVLSDTSQAPLFPQNRFVQHSAGLEFHLTSNSIGRKLVGILDTLEVNSERTDEPLHITATRFRRTIGTRAAAEGHGELVIAELLDHSDIQHVGVYVKSTPEIINRIDRAIALQMAPLAQAFAGILIESEVDAVRGDDRRSRIMGPNLTKNFKPMGNCGKYGFCGFSAPIACYTCNNFQAWLDGPHEAVLDRLIADRERLSSVTDIRIASVNDRTILAVAQVVEECRQYRAAGCIND